MIDPIVSSLSVIRVMFPRCPQDTIKRIIKRIKRIGERKKAQMLKTMLYISHIPTEVDSNQNHDAEDGDDDGSHDVHVHARDDHAEKNHSAFMLSHCDDERCIRRRKT